MMHIRKPSLPALPQPLLRPLIGCTLLLAIAVTLATGDPAAASSPSAASRFDVRASSATSAEAARTALAAQAARACGFATADRGWLTGHRVERIACEATRRAHQCEARVQCTGQKPEA